ncbi:MAG TPA: hypothetical protein ACFYD7_04555 [Candidatus Wujingus californicus]|uniref:hypothetical protein n=1 Tax=Candidatus Wujingus californicus TaxID=3367618 RepID=UPI001DEC231D|nr:hypothetical protein [Planctomycetota bacterium]MDO8094947.1 hypothetical protein [Candidatus Brocadiales bacterium]
MDKTKLHNLDFLLQLDVTGELIPKIGKEQWQTLYRSAGGSAHRFVMWCALLSEDAAAIAFDHDSWDLMIGDGKPGFSKSWSNGKEVTTYHRFGIRDGIRPLILYRTFYDAFPQYNEVDEEFRLYHDLAEDKARGLLLAFDASGREIEVVRISPRKVQARLKHLRQFQAGTGLYVAIYIDSVRYSQIPLEDIPSDEQERVEVDGMVRWRRNIARDTFSRKDFETFSRLLCKVILPPPPKDKAGVWPFKEDNEHNAVAFIIGVDKEGNEVEHTSNPDKLNNYFGSNPGAPHYLTPVYFRREVLSKYFAEPERYRVSDGRLICLSLWSCQIDNDLDSYVVVFLGDLGRDLPYDERLHWRQFNIAPEGGVSETNFRRSFLAQFTDAKAPDLMFRHEYARISSDWESSHGWPLFLLPAPGDAHLLDTVRIPVTNSQAELDEQIGHLAKLLVDSLNEKALSAQAGPLEERAKGIRKLAGFLEKTQFSERESIIQFFRDLQTLRSTGSAHRKGSGYEKIIAKLGVSPTRKPDTVRRLLEKATAALRALRLHYCGKQEYTG